MPKILINQLTDSRIKKFIKDKKPIIADGDNLYLRRGAEKLYFQYRVRVMTNTGYKHSWIPIGSYPSTSLAMARTEAAKIRALVERGIDPKTYKSVNPTLGKTFGHIVELYKIQHFNNLSENSINKWNYTMKRTHILNDIPIDKIIEADILDILHKTDKDNAPSTSAGILQRLKSIFKWAKKQKYITTDQTLELEKVYNVIPRERYLEPKELKYFFNALFSDQTITALYKMTFISMATLLLRIEELLSIKWQDVDIESGRVVINQTKAIKDFRLIVPKPIINLWLRYKQLNPYHEYVFQFRNKHVRSVNIRKVLKDKINSYGIKQFLPHDFRRTGMSLLSELGHNHQIINAALGHVVKGIDAFYMKSHLIDERAKLLNSWYGYIESLLNNENKPVGNNWLWIKTDHLI